LIHFYKRVMNNSLEMEELVSLIFGDDCEPPSDWRENPEFAIYLAELSNLGPDRIATEPERVSEELNQVQSRTQDLAFSNYKTFIQTSNCSQEIFTEFTKTEEHLDSLLSQLPEFTAKCTEFQATASEISSHRRLTSLTLAKHTSLLEVLELPQLMETVVRNHHYEEALELQAYTSRLVKKQPGVTILEDIARNVSNSMKLMLNQLLAQLRAPVQLPQCLKVISYLRRMDVFNETELRLKFLQARETWLNSVIGSVPRDDPYTHLTRTMELVRVHLFDIVTQYRAIFSDEETVGTVRPEGKFDNRLLFTSWLDRKVQEFLTVVGQDLNSPGVTSYESLLGQAMYFGLSFSRVGFDFRPLLVPVFLDAIEKQFISKLGSDSCLRSFSDHLSSLSLERLPSPPTLTGGDDSLQPPLALMDYPPLAHLTNVVLGALNEVRLCAPLALAPVITKRLQDMISEATLVLLNYHSTSSPSWTNKNISGWEHLCSAINGLLLPYLQRCLSAIFPLSDLTQTTGLAKDQLACQGLGVLDREKIMEPLVTFLPVLDTVGTMENEETTEFVADRLEEISIALDSTEVETQEGCAKNENDRATSVNSDSAISESFENEISINENDKNIGIESSNDENGVASSSKSENISATDLNIVPTSSNDQNSTETANKADVVTEVAYDNSTASISLDRENTTVNNDVIGIESDVNNKGETEYTIDESQSTASANDEKDSAIIAESSGTVVANIEINEDVDFPSTEGAVESPREIEEKP